MKFTFHAYVPCLAYMSLFSKHFASLCYVVPICVSLYSGCSNVLDFEVTFI